MLETSTNDAPALDVQPSAGLALKWSPFRRLTHEACHAVLGVQDWPTQRRELYTTEQTARWRKFNGSVRSRGGRMWMRLWYVGPHASQCPAAEATGLVDEVRHAAAQAVDAGFDGVELYVGYGLQLAQYIKAAEISPGAACDPALSLRARLLVDVVVAVAAEVGRERVRVFTTPSPHGDSHARYSFIVGRLGISYLREACHVMWNPPCDGAYPGSRLLSVAAKPPALTDPTAHRHRPVLSGAQDRRHLPA